ncbi:MAG: hypothetical protein KatS3mg108_0352 [Isosphaeraceae bacterium]|jgi:hypothetical protein|nr:MAG: hypothetical protein KatS3mg108_0352 [Isosphaeraceae bacterium]
MLKPLTFSVSLAVALGTCSLGVAGGHGKNLPSPQGAVAPSAQAAVAPSAQAALPSAQGDLGCGDLGDCGPKVKKCHLFDLFKPKPKCYTYEWVLKKKRCGGGLLGGLLHGGKGGCGGDGCDGCGALGAAPSPQMASPQGPLAYSPSKAGIFGSGQIGGSSQYLPTQAPAPAGDAAPAPESAPLPPAADPAGSTAGLLYLSPAGN